MTEEYDVLPTLSSLSSIHRVVVVVPCFHVVRSTSHRCCIILLLLIARAKAVALVAVEAARAAQECKAATWRSARVRMTRHA